MKKILFIIIMMLSVLPAAEAQNVVGKWKCSQEFLHGLGTGFIQMRGRYHFKKDSTFTIKIKGRGQKFYGKNTLQIRIKGTYSISHSAITTKVVPNDVTCYINFGMDIPKTPSFTDETAMLRYDMENNHYELFESMSRTQEETIKRDLLEVWNWNREPLEVTKKTMKVGDKATFKR